MLNKAEIFRSAHAAAKAEVASHPYIAYRAAFARHLRYAWGRAKAAFVIAAQPVALRIVTLEAEILSEECRSFMDFAKVARMRAEINELRAAA